MTPIISSLSFLCSIIKKYFETGDLVVICSIDEGCPVHLLSAPFLMFTSMSASMNVFTTLSWPWPYIAPWCNPVTLCHNCCLCRWSRPPPPGQPPPHECLQILQQISVYHWALILVTLLETLLSVLASDAVIQERLGCTPVPLPAMSRPVSPLSSLVWTFAPALIKLLIFSAEHSVAAIISPPFMFIRLMIPDRAAAKSFLLSFSRWASGSTEQDSDSDMFRWSGACADKRTICSYVEWLTQCGAGKKPVLCFMSKTFLQSSKESWWIIFAPY